ncbi:antitoxin MazE family protein [Indioceanicola profundi]|uniref:antitoxin MazE family protein n=1 Tax=Indioceanicola profundi TaxID=2220096 RepID=UPI000E6AD00B|nr:antitoxin MazE family protein [Indioceanicola profundi]
MSRSKSIRSETAREAGRRKTQLYRDRLRAQGLRPIQLWVPDVRSPRFQEEAKRQSRIVAVSPEEGEINDFLADVQDWGGE